MLPTEITCARMQIRTLTELIIVARATKELLKSNNKLQAIEINLLKAILMLRRLRESKRLPRSQKIMSKTSLH